MVCSRSGLFFVPHTSVHAGARGYTSLYVGMVTYVLTRRLRLSCRHLDASKIRIKTTYQSVHEMCYKDTVAEAKAFWSSFNSFISSNSNFALHRKKPVFNNQEVDLYRLYRTVEKRGGYAAISERKAWKEIAGALQIEDKGNNAGSTLKQWYLKYLQPFKEYSVSRNASGAGMLCDAVETAIYGREKVAKSKRERAERRKVEELDADMDADMDAELDEVEVVVDEVGEVGEVVAGLLDLMPEEDIDIEARKVGEAQPRQQAGQGREGGTPPKKERSSTGEEEDEEDEEVSAMVCEACRGGHYEDQVRWLIQGGMGPFILVCGARLRDGPVGRCVGKGISDRTMPLTRRPVFHAQCRLFCATSATRGGTCSVSSPK